MNDRLSSFVVLFFFLMMNCTSPSISKSSRAHTLSQTMISKDDGKFEAQYSNTKVVIDGYATDAIWARVPWYSMNYVWMGETPQATDYTGKFKLAWDAQYLYILVEVVDDVLHPTLADGLENYWKGDYVEVFIDEDASGGNHQYNHQAFAYHVSTEGHAIDKDTNQSTVFLDDHVQVQRTQKGDTYLWEMAIQLYDKDFVIDNNATPITLSPQKTIGFSIGYGDNDGHQNRENFMGSKQTHGINNDEGYTNADVLGRIVLVE